MSYLKKIKQKIVSQSQIETVVNGWKTAGEKVVFTNGCFDIMHKGHVDYLAKAATLGSKLVLGLNTDESVKRIKGNSRPYQDEASRAMIIAALMFVDAVVLFDEDTPLNLINKVLPDVLVKGADYKAEDIVGYETVINAGGTVKTIAFVEGYSTTCIIEKIKSEGK